MNEIDRLKRARPRSRFVRASVAAFGLLAVYSWFSGEIQVGSLFTSQRLSNLHRFLTEDIVPHPVRESFDFGTLWAWVSGILTQRGFEGMLATLSISVVAIVLAGLVGLMLGLPAARTLMSHDPFVVSGRRTLVQSALVYFARAVQVFMRSIPEYVWAYLFLAMLGPNAWPAILALAIHNAGILGKLNSETVEDLDPAAPRALRALGAERMQIAANAVFPLALPRWLLYFFYRFETCIREATVVGMLGIVSIGYWIADARGKRYYDEMLFLVLLGAIIVLAADLMSALARRFVRRAA